VIGWLATQCRTTCTVLPVTASDLSLVTAASSWQRLVGWPHLGDSPSLAFCDACLESLCYLEHLCVMLLSHLGWLHTTGLQ
jgi:hypothetical protein